MKVLLNSIAGRSLFAYAGPIPDLSLDALILPMNPELTMLLYAPMTAQVLVEAGDNLLELPDREALKLRAQYPQHTKGDFPFWVPSRSAHVIPGHNARLAKKLIYAVPVDANDTGAFWNKEVISDSINNALDLAELENCTHVGLTPLISPMGAPLGRSMEDLVLETLLQTAETVNVRLSNSAFKEVYVLMPSKEYCVLLTPASLMN